MRKIYVHNQLAKPWVNHRIAIYYSFELFQYDFSLQRNLFNHTSIHICCYVNISFTKFLNPLYVRFTKTPETIISQEFQKVFKYDRCKHVFFCLDNTYQYQKKRSSQITASVANNPIRHIDTFLHLPLSAFSNSSLLS